VPSTSTPKMGTESKAAQIHNTNRHNAKCFCLIISGNNLKYYVIYGHIDKSKT